ncbi:hypothetical protein BpHYR1_048600 [Brachionus plicatilis]|uniref:Uncharacterized protein n=1 Tax=Brachionus plicatilis TaxID=10195 RepID=A0A3M7STM6_BRAPC|nr:hypothetical protein BpHYR1_048600 [Brachionus plicatilis]
MARSMSLLAAYTETRVLNNKSLNTGIRHDQHTLIVNDHHWLIFQGNRLQHMRNHRDICKSSQHPGHSKLSASLNLNKNDKLIYYLLFIFCPHIRFQHIHSRLGIRKMFCFGIYKFQDSRKLFHHLRKQ